MNDKTMNIMNWMDKKGQSGLSPEEIECIQKLCEPEPLPFFEASKTALFTGISQRSRVDQSNKDSFAAKIRRDANQLWEEGYDSLIISRGNNYGMLALDTLLEIKAELGFQLSVVKLYGEVQDFSHDRLALIQKIERCDAELHNLFPLEFFCIIRQSSAISHESGICRTDCRTREHSKQMMRYIEYLLGLNRAGNQ